MGRNLTEAGVTKAQMEIKTLVHGFERWHQETYGMSVEDSFKLVEADSDSGNDSDSSNAD